MLKHIRNLWHAKRRQVLVAWLAAWPTLTTILFVLQPFSRDWPLPLRSLASATAMVIMMNFVSVPLVSAISSHAHRVLQKLLCRSKPRSLT